MDAWWSKLHNLTAVRTNQEDLWDIVYACKANKVQLREFQGIVGTLHHASMGIPGECRLFMMVWKSMVMCTHGWIKITPDLWYLCYMLQNRISFGLNCKFSPRTGLLLWHSSHGPTKQLQDRLFGDVEALLRCCLANITLTVVMNRLLSLVLVSNRDFHCVRVFSVSQWEAASTKMQDMGCRI